MIRQRKIFKILIFAVSSFCFLLPGDLFSVSPSHAGGTEALTLPSAIEKALKNMEGSAMKISELKRKLPKQVNHNTLMAVLQYLDESNKIYIGLKGITWIHNNNRNLRKAIEKGLEL